MPTTVKVSVETRDRLRSFGGATLEATIIEALDALEATRFWAQAETAAAWRRSRPMAERTAAAEREARLGRALDSAG